MKLSTFALASAFVLILTSVAAAQFLAAPPRGGVPPCLVDCGPGGDPTDPGDPFIPFDFPEVGELPDPDCEIDCVPGKDDVPETGDLPDPDCQINCVPKKPGDKPKTGLAAADLCGDKLGYLRDVTVSQIESVGTDDLVDIIPVCRSKSLSSEQEDVAELRPVIAANVVLDTELGQEGYNPEDVVGVIVVDQQVTLYVHRL